MAASSRVAAAAGVDLVAEGVAAVTAIVDVPGGAGRLIVVATVADGSSVVASSSGAVAGGVDIAFAGDGPSVAARVAD